MSRVHRGIVKKGRVGVGKVRKNRKTRTKGRVTKVKKVRVKRGKQRVGSVIVRRKQVQSTEMAKGKKAESK